MLFVVPGSHVSSSLRPYPSFHLRRTTATLVTKFSALFIIVGIMIRDVMMEGSVITGTPKSATSSRSYR